MNNMWSLSAFTALLIQCAIGSDVFDWSSGDFKSQVAQYDTVLVEFFAPWCGHCKRLAPEYETAATQLKSNDPPVPLAKVDCTSDGGKDTCSEFGVSGYPTLKIFKGGEFSSEYGGPRDADGIVKYMRTQVGPASRLYDSKERLERALANAKDVLILGVFDNDGKSELQTKFLKAADKLRESINFGHVFTDAVSDALSVKALTGVSDVSAPSIVLVRPNDLKNKFEPNVVVYSSGDLESFIKDNYHGRVGHRIQNNIADFKPPLVVVYYDVDYVKNAKGTNYWRNRVLKVAQNFKDVSFAIANAQAFAGELEEFGLKAPRERDSAPVVGARDRGGKKYALQDKFSIESLEKFVTDFLNGAIEPFLKSEDIPVNNDVADVKVAVGKNFDDLVINSDKDLLIEFYAPWCGHCKKLAPTFEELGAALKDEPGVEIVKMDATANDVPSAFNVQGFPTIYWYPRSKSPQRYEGGRDLNDFIEYVAKHATEELNGYDRNGKKKEPKEEL